MSSKTPIEIFLAVRRPKAIDQMLYEVEMNAEAAVRRSVPDPRLLSPVCDSCFPASFHSFIDLHDVLVLNGFNNRTFRRAA